VQLGTGLPNPDWIPDQVTGNALQLWRVLPRVVPYLRPYRRLVVSATMLSLVAAGLVLAEPWPLALVLDSVLANHPPPDAVSWLLGGDPGTYLLLGFAVAAGFLILVAANAINLLRDYLNAKADQNMVLDFKAELFEHVQGLSMSFHDQRSSGQLMSRINWQAPSLGSIVMAFPPVLEAALTLIGMLVIAALIDWQLALASLAIMPLLLWTFSLYGRRIVPRVSLVQRLEWQSLSIVHEAMAMLRVIRSFGRERYEHRKFVRQGRTAVDQRVKLTVRQNLYTLGVQTITALGTSAILALGAWHVINGTITTGELVVMLAYVTSAYKPLEQISATLGELSNQLVYFNASLALLDAEPEVREAPDAVELEGGRGHVAVEGLRFSYQGRRHTIRDVSFEAEPGERLAIVGPTGAGKTTLISLLIRFYEPDAGRILIDGVDIRKLKLSSLRDQISVVLQEPLLFTGTIADNIRYGKLDASSEEVIAAARAANAHDFISRLPKAYDTELGERGADLSGGERQRVSLARAFLKDAPILVLDEPTSAIDSRTEGVILDALDELMVGRTSFLVAHRLSTLRGVDRILVLSGGLLVEQGTHEELLEAGGLYRELFEAQDRERRRREAAVEDAIRTGEPLPTADSDALVGNGEPADGDGASGVVWREAPPAPGVRG
jgi:ATP-binding cassette subfamily B protein